MRSLICGLTAALLLLSHALPLSAEPVDRIVAVADESVILESELENAVAELERQAAAQGGELPPDDVLRRQVLDRLILAKLQSQRAKRFGIRIDDTEINQTLERIANSQGLSLNEFIQRLEDAGVDYGAYRERVSDELLIARLRQREVDSRVVVTENDIDLYLQNQSIQVQEDRDYRIRHLLVAAPEGVSATELQAAGAEAEALRERLELGEDFAQLAIGHSDGQKAEQGGDMGWIPGNALPTVFSDVVPSLETGQISDVFQSASGFHIIKLEDMRGRDTEQKMMREAKLRHILLQTNEIRDEERTRALAISLHERVQAGADFAELAREYSDDTSSANQGGDLGWGPASNYTPEFAKQINALEPGEVSQPFKTRDGWHLVELQDWRERDSTLEARRNLARNRIAQRKISEEYEVWLRRLRDEAYVEIRLEGYEQDAS